MFVVSMLGGICGVWIDEYWITALLMITAGIMGFFLCPAA
jgi:hypothetical protein